ncbi:hypothetical protein QO001_001427 [Methylobacterium brachiatum]|uniref:Uncharacterized protein n=1 Tax=Methylobacterium brachiatum TaxID=269660 RepID=A0AAJ1TP80_9HYPH|nr:hypothetical protein [Methylobacterium brachiatum]MCB4802167.1 hypothetical protein [Methylobacterium brachiatum]MDQ0542509.1 hypothetical protein [Methylobacterium brachiatum]
MPEPRGRIEPVSGPATDPSVLKALALGGRGWVSRDGRVLAAGSAKGGTALAALPETAAAVVAFEGADAALKALRERYVNEGLARHLGRGGSRNSFHFSHGSFDLANPMPWFHDFLDKAGWIEVELARDEGVRKAFCDGRLLEGSVEAYREVLVTLGDGLGCRVCHGFKDDFATLLYDPTDNDGLGYREPRPVEWPGCERDPEDRDLPLWTSRFDEDDDADEAGFPASP